MKGEEARRAALAARVAALGDGQLRALARALEGDDGAAPDQLVACITLRGAPPSAASLDAFLAERLPDYMIPARYVVLERMPRNRAGKLDREAVDPGLGTDLRAGAPDLVPPRDETEARLVEIWKEVLGLDEIGVHDDFFELGGDSLLSIRAISRAGRAGIRISPEAFFDAPTIARIAAAAAAPAPEAEQGPVTGSAPATPIQEWFFERITEGRDRWNQSLLLRAPPTVGREVLAPAVAALVAHHDALRLRFTRGADGWRQEIAAAPTRPPLRVVDVAGLEDPDRAGRIRAEADDEHGSLRLEEGRLFRVVLFEGGPDFRRVLLVAHHLLVDAVSWGVLLDDLSTLLAQAVRGGALRLPPKTASVLEWAEGLEELASGPEAAAAAAYWTERAAPASRAGAPGDAGAEPGEDRMEGAVTHSFSLDAEGTDALLDGASRRLDARPRELLLAALLLGWSRWTGRSRLQLDVEGHGRDVPGLRADVSRTVGWFTTVFPVTLELRGPRGEDALSAVREAFRTLPLKGAAHGLLRYLHPDPGVRSRLAGLARSELLFNYLGSVDALLPPDSLLERASEPSGRERSPEAPRAYPLEINARVERGRLTVDIEYGRGVQRGESIARFVDAIADALAELAAGPAAGAPRFELADLDEAGLDRVADLLAEIDDR